ncbi:uncharacterized protein TNCV_3749841 [Trichonephila clavipes]|nr:uncharacterized protein TNCV_3749841 [Trichonephila clavipes]
MIRVTDSWPCVSGVRALVPLKIRRVDELMGVESVVVQCPPVGLVWVRRGRGHAALETFSSVLNMPTMDQKTFAKCMHNLSVKNKEVKKKILEMSHQAAREAHVKVDASLKNQEIIYVSVSYDGTWQKRGHTSYLGLGIIIDILSGLVLDFEVLSKYCQNCVVAGRDMGVDSAEFHIWQKGHADECDKSFDGTSGAMEMHAALIMWRRSISDCQMRFVSMLSDGDSTTFQFLSDNKIYGSDIKIEKEECMNHIAKRLGTSLRNKVREWKVKKVTLGGRKQGSLTDKNITKLQNYYRKAIKDNVPDNDKMKTAIYASLMHCSSTDKKPMHGKCPEGESSWCFYKRATAKGDLDSVVFDDESTQDTLTFTDTKLSSASPTEQLEVSSIDSPHTGRPVIENVDKITEIIEVDRHVSSRSIPQELQIDHKTVLNHLRKVGLKKKLDVLVPHQLAHKNMMDPISICEALAKRNEIDPFLKRMMTGEGKWVTCDNTVKKTFMVKAWSSSSNGDQTRTKG